MSAYTRLTTNNFKINGVELVMLSESSDSPPIGNPLHTHTHTQNLSQFYAQFFILQLTLQCYSYSNAGKEKLSKWVKSWVGRPKHSHIDLTNEMLP
jgi:hypothetical protein